MPITVSWDDDAQTITRVQFEGAFVFNDIIEAWKAELALIHSVTHPVYSLNVFGVMPFTVKGLDVKRLREFAEGMQTPNLQMTVQVIENPLLRSVIATLPLNVPGERHVVSSEAQAYALIAQHKASR